MTSHLVSFTLIAVLFVQQWGVDLRPARSEVVSDLAARVGWLEERLDVAAVGARVQELQDGADAVEAKLLSLKDVAHDPEELLAILKGEVNIGLAIVGQLVSGAVADLRRLEAAHEGLKEQVEEMLNGEELLPCTCVSVLGESRKNLPAVTTAETLIYFPPEGKVLPIKEVPREVKKRGVNDSLLDVIFWNVTVVAP